MSFKTLSAQSANIVYASKSIEPNDGIEPKALKIYPNPGWGQYMLELQVAAPLNSEATVQLINATGQVVSSEKGTIKQWSFAKAAFTFCFPFQRAVSGENSG